MLNYKFHNIINSCFYSTTSSINLSVTLTAAGDNYASTYTTVITKYLPSLCSTAGDDKVMVLVVVDMMIMMNIVVDDNDDDDGVYVDNN